MPEVYLTEKDRVLKKVHRQLANAYKNRVWKAKGERGKIAERTGTSRTTLLRWIDDYNDFRKGNIEAIVKLAIELKVDIFK